MLGAICSCCSFFKFVAVIGVLAAALKIYNKLTTGWCRSQVNLKGKTVIVTGANTGIGYETALDLAKRGARVILACRNQQKADEAREKIIAETNNDNIVVQIVDFTSLQSIRDFAKRINDTEERLDILINNHGAAGFKNETVGEEKFDITLLTNYYSQFLLTNLLLGLLKKTGSSRVVNVSSMAAQWAKFDLNDINAFTGEYTIYNVSKLYNILFTIELAKKLKGTDVTTYSLHPGAIVTDIFRRMPAYMQAIFSAVVSPFFKNPTEGAQTTIHCAVTKNIEKFTGEHFHDCHYVDRYKNVDASLSKQFWDKTVELLKISPNELQY